MSNIKRSASKSAFVAFVVAILFSMVGFNAPAQADDKSGAQVDKTKHAVTMTFKTTPRAADGAVEQEFPSCNDINVSTGAGDCVDEVKAESESSDSVKAKVVSVNGVSIHSDVTVLANVRANGTPVSQQDDCFHLDHAQFIWTSYDASGTTGWHSKWFPAGYRMCTMDDGKVRDPKCHNIEQIGRPKSNPPKNAIHGAVKFVKRFVFKAVSVAKIHEKAVSKSQSWCNTQHTHAEGMGKGVAEVWGKGRAVLKGSILVKLFASVNAQAQGNLAANLKAQGVVDVKGQTRAAARGKAFAESRSKAVCTEIPKPPTYDKCPDIPGDQPPDYECNPPKENPPPVIVDIKRVNDGNPNWETPACAKADFESNHGGTLLFSFESGGIIGTNPVSVADLQEGCVQLIFPSDPGTYTFKVTAVDSVTGTSVTKESQPFVVWVSPPPPPRNASQMQ